MSVSRETEDKLDRFIDLLQTWSKRINLVAPATLADARARHVEDSLQLIGLAQSGGHWVDLGSGAGFPGLIVAIAAPSPSTRFTLVESDSRKAAFLRRAIAELGVTRATVANSRIEALPPQGASLVSARALAPLPTLMAYVARHLAPTGTALLPKGRTWRDEVAEARKSWRFEMIAHPSETQPEAAILEISDIHAL